MTRNKVQAMLWRAAEYLANSCPDARDVYPKTKRGWDTRNAIKIIEALRELALQTLD